VAATPRDVIGALDLAQSWIIRVVGRRLRVAFGKLDGLRLNLPIDSIIAPTGVEMRESRSLFQAKHSNEAVAERSDGAVVHSLDARDEMPANDWV